MIRIIPLSGVEGETLQRQAKEYFSGKRSGATQKFDLCHKSNFFDE
jgi:hypothetical protein